MPYSDAWDERERSRDDGLKRIRGAFDSAKWFVFGAFCGIACLMLV